MIEQLRQLEKSTDKRAWLDVAALYPRLRPEARGAFVKALRRLDAPKKAFLLLQTGGSEADVIGALTVFRVMKPKDAPVHFGFEHPSALVRQQAVLAAASVPMHPTLRAALQAAVNDSDNAVRDMAAMAVHQISA